MKKSETKTFKSCPHFLKGMKTCSLFSDGFYLPTKRIISTYCQTSIYKKCPVYQRNYDTINNSLDSGKQGHDSRRRYQRIPDQRKVMIRSCDRHGNLSDGFSESVLTVDYSQGGMHIISNKKIPADTLLMFSFDQDFLIPKLEGFAEVRWQKNLEKSPHGIEAGLAFKDDDSGKALALEIEQGQLNAKIHPSLFSEQAN